MSENYLILEFEPNKNVIELPNLSEEQKKWNEIYYRRRPRANGWIKRKGKQLAHYYKESNDLISAAHQWSICKMTYLHKDSKLIETPQNDECCSSCKRLIEKQFSK